MDALIRLDVLMPIAPLTETETMPNNRSIRTSQHTSNEHDRPVVIDDLAEVIDLTVSKGEAMSMCPSTPIPLPFWPDWHSSSEIIDLEENNIEDCNAVPLPSTKHKIALVNNDIPQKVARIAWDESNVNRPRSHISSPRKNTSQPIIPPAATSFKTHTVTSSDVSNVSLLGPGTSTGGRTSNESNSFGPRQISTVDMPIFQPSLPVEGPSHRHNQTLSQNFHMEIVEDMPNLRQGKQTKQEQPSIEIGTKFGQRSKEQDDSMIYQLLDMFPDIDLKFLQSKCSLGLDINQVTEMILEMNNYPKYQNLENPTMEPKAVPHLNANFSNSNFQTNAFLNTQNLRPTLANGEVKLVPERNQPNNLFPGAVPDATKSLLNDLINLGQSSTLKNTPETRNEPLSKTVTSLDNENNLTASNSQNSTRDVLLDENIRNRLEGNENKNLPGKINPTQDKLDFLIEIFPDADIAFLETKSKLKANDLTVFIAESMEKRDYPKTAPVKEENKALTDESIEIGKYTTNFNIENFLKIFPDPFGYFMDEKRNCQYTNHGIGFLKRRYRNHLLKVILLKYKEFKYNLVKTCEFLDSDSDQPTRCTKRGINEIKMPEETNLPFLQEACFIEHKTEIKNYFDQIAEKKRLAYEQAEAKGELIDCGCCYESIVFEDCAACNEGHLFCKTCVRRSMEVRIEEGHTSFPCVQSDSPCESVFSLQLLETLINATMFSRLLQRIQLDEVKSADIEGLEVCPFCDFAIILPPETNIFKCLNPECLKESCRKCHKPSHIPQRCEEVENDDQARARKYIEDEMTRALVRECYKCKKSFIKIDGCNKMTCTCGARMCYICRQPIINYEHFNGPGGEANQKCPLYSTEKLLHVDAVEAVAKKALEEVSAKNPELKLKHDPTKILPPAAEAKTTLPPGVNEQADRLMNVLQNLHRNNDRDHMQNPNAVPPPNNEPARAAVPHQPIVRPANDRGGAEADVRLWVHRHHRPYGNGAHMLNPDPVNQPNYPQIHIRRVMEPAANPVTPLNNPQVRIRVEPAAPLRARQRHNAGRMQNPTVGQLIEPLGAAIPLQPNVRLVNDRLVVVEPPVPLRGRQRHGNGGQPPHQNHPPH